VGETANVVASYGDVGSLDTHSVSIDWGDGTSSVGTAAGGTASGSHTYASGGIYTVTLTLSDDDSSSDTATTTAYVSGVGVSAGQLQIIGTSGDDLVTVNLANGDQVIRIHASFLPPNPGYIDVPLAAVSSILLVLLGGNDQATLAGNMTLPAVLDGGSGDDRLNAGGGGAVLLGGTGNDFLQGNTGNDILIGGLDADVLIRGPDEDILIGGTTIYDGNDSALLSLLAEWTSSRTFAERVTNTHSGAGPILTGQKFDETTVSNDGAVDRLNGASGSDWFFLLFDEDEVNLVKSDEQVN